jgi:hypothetical protein
MSTWESWQHNRPIGRTRVKLADALCKAMPGLLILPEDLQQNHPSYSRQTFDCCTWDAWGTMKLPSGNTVKVHFYSWSSMGDIVKKGRTLTLEETDPCDYDVDYDEPK